MSTPIPTICLTAPQTIDCINQPGHNLESTQVRIQTHCSLISSGTEMSIYRHAANPSKAWQEFARFPRSMGYSNVGTVIEVGTDVDSSWLGKRVASRGCHAAFVLRELGDLRIVPDDVSDEDATFSTLAAVAMNGLRRGRLIWGENIGVLGLGILGQLTVRLSQACGAHHIAAVDILQDRLARLPDNFKQNASAQPNNFLAFTSVDALKLAIDKSQFPNLDIFVEASGQAKLIANEIACLRDQGRLLLLSSPRESTLFDFHEFCNRKSVEIIGAHGFSQPHIATPANPWTSQAHSTLFLNWLSQKKFSVTELISHRFSWQDAKQAYQRLHTDPENTAAVIIQWIPTCA